MNEWGWFILQLRVAALDQSRPPGYEVRYWMDELPTIVCTIFSETMTDRVLSADRQEQEECFRNWWDAQCELVEPIIKAISGISSKINVRRDLVLQVMRDYGMGGAVVCSVREGKVSFDA